MKEKKSYINLIVILILLFVVLGILSIIFISNSEWFKARFIDKSVEKNEVELKYTEVGDKVQEGIYITDVSEVVENVMPSIVSITSKTLINNKYLIPNIFNYNNNVEQYSEGAGSGIIISKSDTELMILTNNHVVEGTNEIAVSFINGKRIDATVKGVSKRKDIAIICVKLEDIDEETLLQIKVATIGDSDELKVGNGVIAIGNALGYGQSVTTGVVSALNREIKIDNYTNKMIQIDAAINGGNSGGALLNSKGEVVGINSAKYSSSGGLTTATVEGVGFAIPISDVKDVVTALINGEEDISEVSLGVEGYIITEQYSKVFNMPAGFYITKIESGSNADKAGIQIGNIVTKIEEQEVKDFDDIQDVLNDKKKSDKIKLTIMYANGREYKEKDVEVTLN